MHEPTYKNGTNIPPENDGMFNFDIELRENVSDHTRQICVTNKLDGEVVFVFTMKTAKFDAASEDVFLYYSTLLCEELQDFFETFF